MTATSRDTITVQGRLTNPTGAPLESGQYPLCFRLCDSGTNPCMGAAKLFEEEKSVFVGAGGLYTANIGAGTSLDNLKTNEDVYLEVATGTPCASASPLAPRIPLASSAFAFRAKTADTADVAKSVDSTTNLLVADGVFTGDLSVSGAAAFTGNVGIGTTSPKSALDVAGGIKVGTMSVCDADTAGSIRYNAGNYGLELCDGYNWFMVKQGQGPFTCGAGTVNDIDGNTYNTVLIGAQCWMGENMRTTKYPGGSSISKGPSAHIVAGWTTDVGYYSCPPNTDSNGEDCTAAGGTEKLGMLYQWSAMMNGVTGEGAQGICPSGWHIPTDAEYKTLETYLGMCTGTGAGCVDAAGWRGTTEGDELKKSGLCEGRTPCGTSGFNGLLPGDRDTYGGYYGRGSMAYIWSSTQQADGTVWVRAMDVSGAAVSRSAFGKAYPFSARCLKD